MNFGQLPPEYNARIHGPYFPGHYYGKKDVNVWDVKLGELPSWMARKSWNPVDWFRAAGRWYWRYQVKWVAVKKGSMAPILQLAVVAATWGYISKFSEHRAEKHAKYH